MVLIKWFHYSAERAADNTNDWGLDVCLRRLGSFCAPGTSAVVGRARRVSDRQDV